MNNDLNYWKETAIALERDYQMLIEAYENSTLENRQEILDDLANVKVLIEEAECEFDLEMEKCV